MKHDYIVPEKYLFDEDNISSLKNEKIIVCWDGEDDPENPRNWPIYLKAIFVIEIFFITLSVYIGSAVYTHGIDEIIQTFNVGQIVATLPSTLLLLAMD